MKSFPARKIDIERRNTMTYSKPEIAKIADAASAICLDNALIKSVSGADLSNPHEQTAPAYAADDE